MLLSDIRSSYWSTAIAEFGEVVTDLEDIKQCLYIILFTRKGTAPFRPFFGCDLFERLDQPINVAAPRIVNDVRDAIAKWETRIVVQAVLFTYEDNGAVHFKIYWKPIEGTRPGQENTLTFAVKAGSIYLVNEFNQYIETEYGLIEL